MYENGLTVSSTLNCACDNLSMLRLKSIHVSEMGPRYQLTALIAIWTEKEITRYTANNDNKVTGIRCLPN